MQTFRDTIRYRHVLFALTAKELKAQYRNMSLGFLWAIVNPLVMVTVLSVVFSVFFAPNDPYHPARVVIGLVAFNFWSYCVSGCAGSILANSSLVRKVRFPRQILPYSVILSHLVDFAIQSTLVIGVIAVFGAPVGPWSLNLLWLPIIVGIHVGLCVGAGMLVAALNVVFRDTQYIVGSLMTVLFWASPVVYDAHAGFDAAGPWTWKQYAYFLNPISGVLDGYRRILFWGDAPDPAVTLIALGAALLIGVVGMRVFWHFERQFAELCR